MIGPYEGWNYDLPPLYWERMLAMDIGGATPNVMMWFAQDPESKCIVAYDEIAKVTTDMSDMAKLAMPKMKHPSGSDYVWKFKIGDYENRVALDDMSRHGIRFTNAVKHNKIVSVHRLSGYLHPNPLRPFPLWHPDYGKYGSPLLFITPNCKTLIREIPLQKWKQERGQGDQMKDELDRAVRHDAVDCALYVTRVLPAPAEVPVPKIKDDKMRMNLMSVLYYEDVKKFKNQQSQIEPRRKYNPSHQGGTHWHSLLAL